MTLEVLQTESAVAAPLPRRADFWRASRRNPGLMAGALIVVFMVAIGVLAPLLGTIDPAEINPAFRNKKPGAERTIRTDEGAETRLVHRFGTDTLGRDIYSRTVYGARVSLIIGVTVAIISVGIGLIIGLIAGYIRWADGVIMRVMDGLM
ncbi:MAG: ABC transporter permease, partial [Rhodospirillales bacterium]|nr:ABC transporter permease [Rhodospirillales bacterium]